LNELPHVDDERAAEITALFLRRSALSKSEAALLREVYAVIFEGYFDLVWHHLVRRGIRDEAEAEEALQEVFFTLFLYILENGFPESIPAMLHTIAEGRARNHNRAERRAPVFVPVPSSGSEKPRSARDIERIIDVQTLLRVILPEISPEQRQVVELVLLEELTCADAAAVLRIPDGTVKSRLLSARNTIAERIEALWPASQR
jgi:RNA polymerase sigma-70 factor (ECF subfamily)